MFEKEVAAGVAWLDTNNPGWRDKITQELDMSDTCGCVLGQLYKLRNIHFFEGFCHTNGINMYDMGFSIRDNGESTEHRHELWRRLETEWLKYIRGNK